MIGLKPSQMTVLSPAYFSRLCIKIVFCVSSCCSTYQHGQISLHLVWIMIVYADKARYVPERMGLQGKDKIQLNRQWPIPLSCQGKICTKAMSAFWKNGKQVIRNMEIFNWVSKSMCSRKQMQWTQYALLD